MKKKIICAVISCISFSICGCGESTEKMESDYNDMIEAEESIGEVEETSDTAEEDAEEDEEIVSTDTVENGLIFSTEYEIEDYCQGCFIISKNDGLLYGVLDRKGEEILPVKYDEITFLNKDRVSEGTDENLYLQTKYENDYAVVNSTGQEILDKKVSVISYKIGESNADSAFFREDEKTDDLYTQFIRFYKEDGTLLSELNCNGSYVSGTIMVSPDYYLLSTASVEQTDSYSASIWFENTYLYDKNNEVVEEWGGCNVNTAFYQVEGEKLAFYLQANEGEFIEWLVDSNGNTEYKESLSKDEFESVVYTDKMKNVNSNEYYNLGENGNIKLYLSNETWKLENASGEALYEDRYYTCKKKEDCYLLSNEDNQVCMIDRNGNLVVDYGWIELQDKVYYFAGKEIDSDNFFSGDDGVCFIIKTDDENQVYFFK